MFGKYKTPIFLIIFFFLIQFLGNPVPRHEPPKIANTPFDYLLLIISGGLSFIAIIWIILLRNDK